MPTKLEVDDKKVWIIDVTAELYDLIIMTDAL